MEQNLQDDFLEQDKIEIFILAEDPELYSNISVLFSVINDCFGQIPTADKRKHIQKLLTRFNWFEHYQDKDTGRKVLSQTQLIKYPHELATAIRLTKMKYEVIFAPGGLFTRDEKKFDVLLVGDRIILKADLKYINSKQADTIAQRIKSGSEQASRVVIDINSNIKKRDLIDGLRSGVERNRLIKEIILFYNGKNYRLDKNRILKEEISKIIK